MSRDAADVADWIVLAITSYVTSSPAVLARLVVRAVGCEMPRFEAVVAEPQVSCTRNRVGAVSRSVSSFAARVADSFV